LLSKSVVHAGCARIETIRRKISGNMGWHFRQPEPVLFWYRRGAARRLRGALDGRRIDHAFAGNLALFPADMEIDGEFKLDVSAAEYTVVFFQASFVETRGGSCLDRAKLGFRHPSIARGLEELCREAQDPDATFDMLAEGWAIQTMAHLHRVGSERPEERAKGGLSRVPVRRHIGIWSRNGSRRRSNCSPTRPAPSPRSASPSASAMPSIFRTSSGRLPA
jgi:AraC family transcriptional regulator